MAEQGDQGKSYMCSFCSVLNTADSRHFMERKPSPGKGLGLFAKENIPRGTRVLAEGALLAADDESNAKDIVRVFESLSPSQQDTYLDLHEHAGNRHKLKFTSELGCEWQGIPALHRQVLSIYAANAFSKGVFLLGSRMNHSCLPNIIAKYNPDTDKRTFHAIRDIDAQEELTVSYSGGLNSTLKQRKAELQEEYGFLCTCPACENSGDAKKGEEKRAEMFIIDQKIAMATRSGAWAEQRRLAQKLAAIQLAKGAMVSPGELMQT
jgi:hypothetical protein